jgi:uncharacterized protein
MLSKNITKLIGDALKSHDEVRLSTLRLLSSAFNYEFIAKQHELTEEEELAVVRKEAKQRRDSIEAYKKAGAVDRAEREEAELKILQEYLPPEMSEQELSKLVDEAIRQIGAKATSDMGRVIGLVKSKAPNVDGGKIAQIINSKLNNG